MFKNSKLIQATLLVITLSALNKITGFFKLLLSSEAFGTSADADAMAAAWQLPDVFFVMVSGGAMATALIPVFSAAIVQHDKGYQQRLANSVLTIIALILGALCLSAVIFAPWLARVVLVPDFSPEQQILTANLMRIALLGIFIFGLSSILVSLLHSYQHFLAPALGSLLFDTGFVLGLYFGAEKYGVHAMVWGGVLGIILHFCAQLIAIRYYDISPWPQLDFSLPEMREILRLLWPRLVILGSLEIVDIVVIRLASGLPEGSTSAWFFTVLLTNMPVDLFGVSLLVTFLPTLSEEFNAAEYDKLHDSLMAGLRYLWLLLIPSFVGLVALGPAGISVLMERGEFTAESTRLVYSLIAISAAGSIAIATYDILSLAYFARHDTLNPMIIQVVSIALGIVSMLALVGPIGIYGIAFGRLIYTFVVLIGAWFVYRRLYEPLEESILFVELGRSIGAAACMAVVIRLLAQLPLSQLMFVIVAIPTGGLVYLIVHLLSGGTAFFEIWNGAIERLNQVKVESRE